MLTPCYSEAEVDQTERVISEQVPAGEGEARVPGMSRITTGKSGMRLTPADAGFRSRQGNCSTVIVLFDAFLSQNSS